MAARYAQNATNRRLPSETPRSYQNCPRPVWGAWLAHILKYKRSRYVLPPHRSPRSCVCPCRFSGVFGFVFVVACGMGCTNAIAPRGIAWQPGASRRSAQHPGLGASASTVAGVGTLRLQLAPRASPNIHSVSFKSVQTISNFNVKQPENNRDQLV